MLRATPRDSKHFFFYPQSFVKIYPNHSNLSGAKILPAGRELLHKTNLEDYRKGAVGALMDEYERAALELKFIVEKVGEADYERVADAETKDADCHSIQTIMNHVVHAGYGYANGVRRKISMPFDPLGDARRQISQREIADEIDKVLAYTVETLEGRWEMSYAELEEFVIERKANFSENLEQLLEHAVLHILRHRRQIEKFLLKFGNQKN